MIIDPSVFAFLADAPVFFQPWWLDAVAPGSWAYAVVRRGDAIAAVLPYCVNLRLGIFRLIAMPPFTPYAGPWLRPINSKYANRLGEEKDLMTELIDALPPFASFQQAFHPSITNWLPFCWRGFQQTTRYTYRMDETKDLDALWSETRDNVRTDIKKARKQVTITEAGDIDDFLPLYRMTFSRQGKEPPFTEAMMRRIESACAEHGTRRILIARGSDGQPHAGVYLISDSKTVYYFHSGGDPQLRSSGATSLLIWEAIQWASAQGKQFDFEGSMVEPIERFFRAFGGRQVAYFGIEKCDSAVMKIYRAVWRWTHR